jgi:hypothetical protein
MRTVSPEAAIRERLTVPKKSRHKGKPFPKRDGEIRGGRPID